MLTLKTRHRIATAVCATVGALVLTAGPAHAATATKTAIPLQASGYSYMQVAWGGGTGFEAVGFDASSWAVGQAAFGTTGGPCVQNNNGSVHTPWALGTDMLVRKAFTLPTTATNVRVVGAVDNDATVFVNGVQIGFVASGFCNPADINFAATSAVGGTNLLAVRGHGDASTASYLDQQVTYDVPVFSLCLLYDPAKAHKLGSTIPLKFQLCDENGNNVSSPSIIVHAASLTKQDNSASSTVEDSGQANPGDDFRYSEDLAGYIFNKSTKSLSLGHLEADVHRRRRQPGELLPAVRREVDRAGDGARAVPRRSGVA